MQITDRREELTNMAECRVSIYLLKMRLRKALMVCLIIFIRTPQDNRPFQFYHFLFEEDTSLLILVEHDLVTPCGRLKVVANIDLDNYIRIATGRQTSNF